VIDDIGDESFDSCGVLEDGEHVLEDNALVRVNVRMRFEWGRIKRIARKLPPLGSQREFPAWT
jgi:hypothetical protein